MPDLVGLPPQFDLRKAFNPGRQFHVDNLPGSPEGGNVVLEQKEVGRLTLTSGEIVATDPLTFPEIQPLALRVSKGRYHVVLAIAQIRTTKFTERRALCAKLVFTDAVPVVWRNALPTRSRPLAWKPGERFGYAV